LFLIIIQNKNIFLIGKQRM